jgi:hypothetical protein
MKMDPAKSFTADPGQPLRKLSDSLRHPETWPPGFKFDYLFADKCALGLAHELEMIDEPTLDAAMAASCLSLRDACEIFVAGWCEIEVSAAMVADRIDAHLARQGSGQ